MGAARVEGVFLRAAAIAVWVALAASGCALIGAPNGKDAAKLDEAGIRAFRASEEAAWVAHDFGHYYALCAPDAVFVSVRWNADGTFSRERRTAAEDRAAAEAFFGKHPGKFTESDAIDRIVIAPDGQSARILGHEIARVEGERGAMRATTEETVVLRGGRILSLGQTDTQVK